ncbi:MAG TPA: Ohr family peroxiredoxin [Solirubrobacteraceae bacterium]|nr:Ohr family peroxiredoxin [Solirubrobacteraceae bacterium]
MEVFYTATGVSTGDGRSGSVALADGTLELDMSLAGHGSGANPEQLFALGYAACFHSALKRVAGQMDRAVDGSTVSATVGLGRDGEAFGLEVELRAAVPGLAEEEVRELLEAAHGICPYSRATRGNIPVKLTVG